MPTTYYPTDTITLYSTLINYDPATGEEFPVNADNVDGFIYKWNGTTYVQTNTFEPTDDPEVGMVSYAWTPGSEGKFKIVFETTIYSNTGQDVREIYIGPLTPTETLKIERTETFLAEFEPMYLSPDEVLRYYPRGDATEIAESIYYYSKRAEVITGATYTSTTIPPLVHDYILASVLCDYSRQALLPGDIPIWGFPNSGGLSEGSSYQLGDLKVSNESGSSSGSSGSTTSGQFFSAKYGNAESWCQLAAFILSELTSGSAGIKSYIKAVKQPVVVRSRAFHRFD